MNLAPVKATFVAFNDDKCQRLAAAIAYSTIFSIAPLLIVVVALFGAFVGGDSQTQARLLDIVQRDAGKQAADTLGQIIHVSFDKPRQGIIAQVVGWVAFVIGASGLFSALQDALNAVWHVESTKGGWRQLVRSRLASFGMILVVGFLLLVTFVANGVIAFVGAHFLSLLPYGSNPAVIASIDQVVSFGLVTVIFAMIFKILPDVTVAWRDVWIGAAATALLFVVGEALIAIYFAVGGVTSAYGAAGSLLVALLWIYYSAMILLLGAEFTKINAKRVRLIVPSVIRATFEQPAGVDPRASARATEKREDAARDTESQKG